MRVPALMWGIVVAAVVLVARDSCAQAKLPAISPGQLVREVVYNELGDHERHGYWRYFAEKHTQQGTMVEDQIETADGTVKELVLSNGRPLGRTARQLEREQLDHLLASDADKSRLRREHFEDERRIGRILGLLPDAFLFAYVNEENGCWHLRFWPNPQYPAQGIEARIFHAMTGELWIDARMKHLVRLDGRLQSNVDFGYGLLGRLYKDGWFRLERTQVSATDWKTNRLEIHMNGRAMLFKTIARETSEVRSTFTPVPAAMSLKQGVDMLSSQNVAAPPPTARGISTSLVANR
ncbi:MAG TPA: hypothetical protein VKB47_00680 [Terracidiphilus sp.]|nr:hypothetical protein [Terracidiphilus sp.]